MQSAGICCPASSRMMSSRTMSRTPISVLYAVAHDLGGRRDEHGELVDLFFGEDLLHDADEQVRREDGDEQELRERRARIGEGERHDEAQQVEEGADIAYEDARVGLGVLFVDVVEEKLRKAQLHLFGREPLSGTGRKRSTSSADGMFLARRNCFEQFFSVELLLGRGRRSSMRSEKRFSFCAPPPALRRRFVGRSVQAGSPFSGIRARPARFSLLYTVCAQMSKITQRVSLFFARRARTVAIRAKKSV